MGQLADITRVFLLSGDAAPSATMVAATLGKGCYAETLTGKC